MYSREKVELFLLATEDGMGPTAAAEFAGVTVSAAKKWATGHLPRSYTGGGCRIVARKPPRKEASLGPDKSIYAPPATGPLAGLNEDQIENLLLRAVLADLKAEGWDPASISNRSKCELGERLRRATALPLRSITGFLRISKSSYEYWRPRVAAPRDRDADIRGRVVRIFREGSGCWGYRTVWARLRREGVRASEKRVARVMREEGLEVVYNKRRARGYSSYAGEVSKAPENLVNRDFHADEPNRLWLTDITEFRLPGGEKVYLSPVIDCFGGMLVAWSIGLHPDKRLTNSSLRLIQARFQTRQAIESQVVGDLRDALRALGDGRLERIEVDHNQVDRADFMRGHGGGVFGIVAHRQQSAMDLGVQRLDPPVHHLGKAGQLGNVLHRKAGIAQRLSGAAGRHQFHAAGAQGLAQFDQASLVGNGKQRTADGDIGHRLETPDSRGGRVCRSP